ncbi:transposase domain-containing protein [Zoogloea sp.]|uniref:transposase domain-containing protein n=1 Tax=Zoogloea sp. TaxID=49181 RepID=UPI00344DE0B0
MSSAWQAQRSVVAHWTRGGTRPFIQAAIQAVPQRIEWDVRRCGARARFRACRCTVRIELFQSARLNGHEPFAYLEDVLTRFGHFDRQGLIRQLPNEEGRSKAFEWTFFVDANPWQDRTGVEDGA